MSNGIPAPNVDQIIATIQSLDLKTALEYLVVQKIKDFSGSALGKIKKIIQDKQNEGKYAFFPDKDEAIYLRQAHDSPRYKQVRRLIPKYRYIDLICTGLLIAKYQENTSNDKLERIGAIKAAISVRPNGKYLLKIVNLPTTPFFSTVLVYLQSLQAKGHTVDQLEQEFNEIVESWEVCSMFVKSEHHVEDVIRFSEHRMLDKDSPFFLLGMRSASYIVREAVSQMDSKDTFTKNGYSRSITEPGNQKIEVMAFINSD